MPKFALLCPRLIRSRSWHLKRSLRGQQLVLSVLALSLSTAWAGADSAGEPSSEGVALKLIRSLGEVPLKTSTPGLNAALLPAQLPAFIRADSITSVGGIMTKASGNAELRKLNLRIKADTLAYNQETDIATADGNVRIAREGVVYSGPFAQIATESGVGFFTSPTYRIARPSTGLAGARRVDGGGTAERVDFIDLRRAVATGANYSTCTADDPAWIMTASKVRIDLDDDSGVASDAKVSFMGVPLLYAPSLSFPLSDKRRSGFLPPLIALSNRGGLEYSQPYYWNIAPNRDATITPFLSTRRGVGVDSEFRYLEPNDKGELRLDWLPSDRVADRSRWGVNFKHEGRSLDYGIGYAANVVRVSDDNYWKDFPRTNTELSQRLLPVDFGANYALGDSTFSARALKWQTLQDASAPIASPYDILPQITWRYQRYAQRGFDYGIEAEASRFSSSTFISGQRLALAPYVSFPLQTPGYYVVPRLSARVVRYHTDRPMTDGRTSAGYSVPTFSLDAGAVFERSASYFGRNFTQTIEPRLFYARSPYRNQASLPVFDTSAYEFSFASVFSDNAFAGYDRVADNNTLTVGATSRLIDPDSGAERVRLQFAQRFRFTPQNVTLAGAAPNTERVSDLLLGATFDPGKTWSFDGTVQYNQEIKRSVRLILGARYSPEPFKTFNMAYRLSRGNLEQIDFAWQWPFAQRAGSKWYGVGRLNYSLGEKRVTDAIAGIEYEACCWLFRAVAQRVSTTTNSSSTKFFLQLELSGLGRLGSNPLVVLKQNIPQYRVLREDAQPTEPYANYE